MRFRSLLGVMVMVPGIVTAQTVVRADSAHIQPTISRDNEGFKSCGFRAVVLVKLFSNRYEMFDFSVQNYSSYVALIKAGKYLGTHEQIVKGNMRELVSYPAPKAFWIGKANIGETLVAEQPSLSEDRGFTLFGADFLKTIEIIKAVSEGDRMQFAVRYDNEKVDRIVSFTARMSEEEYEDYRSCAVGMLRRMRSELEQ